MGVFFKKIVEKIRLSLTHDKITGTSHEATLALYLTGFFLELERFQI
jgi:hypothetical protein